MLRNQLKSFGAKWELYFENRTPNAFGSLLRGGVSKPVSQNDWWDIRKLRTRPNYVLSIMQENGAGSYRNENGFECQLSYGKFYSEFPGIEAKPIAREKMNIGTNYTWDFPERYLIVAGIMESFIPHNLFGI